MLLDLENSSIKIFAMPSPGRLSSIALTIVAVAGLAFGRDAAQAAVAQLGGLLGEAGGSAVEEILTSTAGFSESAVAVIVGVVTLVVAGDNSVRRAPG